ncbi:hypothetical protein [Photobacterium sp. TLY01]|uniref:hypothetical protein n=1 Tax=Photobacterium sp. TLY01 TaxID=2907534 RepID=UPI001F43C6F4|nr:hypothetical protein [Photobacterium sp. TLY01]UIP29833.1 hypothetical protein LN341_19920 [Photobacterium sp. TLY01]
MTRAAVILCSLLALAGCDEETLENLIDHKVEVFSIDGAQIEGAAPALENGYYSWDVLKSNLNIPVNAPDGDLIDLSNYGGEETGCAKIEVPASGLCFKEGDADSCVPEQVKMIGLKTYTIDLDYVSDAIDVGFYPVEVETLSKFGFSTAFTIEDTDCTNLQ